MHDSLQARSETIQVNQRNKWNLNWHEITLMTIVTI